MQVRKFRKKPIIIEAIQYDGQDIENLKEFFGDFKDWKYDHTDGVRNRILIKTLEGDHYGLRKDWIIKGVKGEFYPCKPDIFQQTYEEVSADSSHD